MRARCRPVPSPEPAPCGPHRPAAPGPGPPAQVPASTSGWPCFPGFPVVPTRSTWGLFSALAPRGAWAGPSRAGGRGRVSGVLTPRPDVCQPLRKFALCWEFSGLAEAPAAPRLPAARGRRPGRLRPWFLPGQRAAPMWGSRLPVLLSRWLRVCVWGGGSVLSHLCHLLPESQELGCFNDLEPQPPEAQAAVVRSCCLAKLRENTLTDHVGFSGLWLYSVKESLNNTSFPPTPSLGSP